jgi:DNA-binding GntR family transcriptional regulator
METAGQAATRVIRERILSGELEAGTKLNQHELATDLGMSRIPVRDALRSLAGEGLVDLRARATAVVTPLTMEDLEELYDLRISLEPRLGRRAVPHLEESNYQELAEQLETMEATPDAGAWLELNNRFHETLYRAAGRRRSLDMIRVIRRQTDRYTAVYIELNHAQADTEHRMILDAARNGQTTRIEALLTAHISASYEQMLRFLASESLQNGPKVTRGKPR